MRYTSNDEELFKTSKVISAKSKFRTVYQE